MNGQLAGAGMGMQSANSSKLQFAMELNLNFSPLFEMYNVQAVGSYLVRSIIGDKPVYEVRDSAQIFDAIRKLREGGPRPISQEDAMISVAYLG